MKDLSLDKPIMFQSTPKPSSEALPEYLENSYLGYSSVLDDTPSLPHDTSSLLVESPKSKGISNENK